MQIDRRSLSDDEKALIRAAERQIWTDDLRLALARACINRGFLIHAYATVDVLVETLEAAAVEPKTQRLHFGANE